MKHSVYKLQTGGSAPFVDYMYVPLAETATPDVAASAKRSDDEIGLKDLLELASKMKGLPSDAYLLKLTIGAMYKRASIFNNGKLDYSQIVRTYLDVLHKVKTAEYNLDLYDKSKETCKENDGLFEAVINEDGQILVYDGNLSNMQFTSVNNYVNNSDKLKIITNGNLLRLRAENNVMAFNNDCLNLVANGIGFKKVTEYILKVLDKIKDTEVERTGYVSHKGNSFDSSLSTLTDAQELLLSEYRENPDKFTGDLSDLIAPEGLYKLKRLDKSNYEQIASAEKYLWNAMPENMRTFLKLKSDGTLEGAYKLMDSLITGDRSSKIDRNADLLEKLDLKGRSKSTDELKMTEPMQWVAGKGYRTTIKMNFGTSDSLPINVNKASLTKSGGGHMGECTLSDVYSSEYANQLDWNHMYFGNQIITNPDLIAIMDGNIYGAWLPIDLTDPTKPNLNWLKAIEEADDEIRSLGIDETDYEKINEVYRRNKLPVKYTKSGKINDSVYKHFAIFLAAGTSNAIGGVDGEEDKLLHAYHGLQAQTEVDRIEKILNKGKEKHTLKLDVDGFFSDDPVYKGLVFIPTEINPELIAAATNLLIPESQIQERDERTQTMLRGIQLKQGLKNYRDLQ